MSNFDLNESEDVLVINLPTSIEVGEIEEFSGQMKSWLLKPCVLHILNFRNTVSLNPKIYPLIIQYKK